MKKVLIGLAIITGAFAFYTFFVTRNIDHMTVRQRIMKAIYPAIMWASKKAATKLHNDSVQPAVPFYSLRCKLIDGTDFDFGTLKGKKVILVNTASDCGFTDQFAELEQLYRQYQSQLVIIGFPANDFKEQEKGDNHAIAAFCQKNYGVSFPIMEKGQVIAGANQQPVYQWLSDAAKNGWNSKVPSWNFSKYVVNENGMLTDYFDPGVSPLSNEVISVIQTPAK